MADTDDLQAKRDELASLREQRVALEEEERSHVDSADNALLSTQLDDELAREERLLDRQKRRTEKAAGGNGNSDPAKAARNSRSKTTTAETDKAAGEGN